MKVERRKSHVRDADIKTHESVGLTTAPTRRQ